MSDGETNTSHGVRAWSTTLVTSSLTSNETVSSRSLAPQSARSARQNRRALATLEDTGGSSSRSAAYPTRPSLPMAPRPFPASLADVTVRPPSSGAKKRKGRWKELDTVSVYPEPAVAHH